jgi:hypothetical protein
MLNVVNRTLRQHSPSRDVLVLSPSSPGLAPKSASRFAERRKDRRGTLESPAAPSPALRAERWKGFPVTPAERPYAVGNIR